MAKEIKDILDFDDAKFAQFDKVAVRINLGLADAQGKAFNQLAAVLDISPLCLLRVAIAFFIRAYSVEPETLLEESRRAHEKAARAHEKKTKELRQYFTGPAVAKAGEQK